MPKCLVCGKKGLFLKLTNGLCSKCLSVAQQQVAIANTRTFETLSQVTPHCNDSQPVAKNLSFVEKELLAVQRTTLRDVQESITSPFSLDGRLEKDIQPHSHPFAYMDICGKNISIAKDELAHMNSHIALSRKLCSIIPKGLSIPVNDIIFRRFVDKNYSRLICSPVTYLGEPTKYPLSLSFTTDMEPEDTTHGDLKYGPDGTVQQATIYFWRKGLGYFFYYVTVDGSLTLEKIEYSGELNSQIRPSAVYKAPYILEREAKREQEEKDFEWIKQNLPDSCPKNITGYRRMKTQNTKNFQILKALAAEQGREI